MVVWLRYGQGAVGITDGLIRSADFANLVSTDDALYSLNEQARQLLESTQATCDEMLSTTQAQVAALLGEAEAIKRSAAAEGLRIGRAEGLNTWTQRAVDQAVESRAMLERQKVRMRDIVSLCVERLVGETDRRALFARALKAISKLVQDVPMLTLRVHESDLAAARAAVDELVGPAGSKFPIEVTADSNLQPGACLFESDLGVIDAGLENQVQAVRSAVARATQQMISAPPLSEPVRGNAAEAAGELPALGASEVAAVAPAAFSASPEPEPEPEGLRQ
jgi:type III secretion protein L